MPIITGLFSGIGLSVGWIGAIIAAVVAAIVAIVVYWDDIKYFFTDTLPQLWSQFVEWICGIATKVGDFFSEVISAIGSFFVNCWDAVVSVFTGIGQWMQEYVIQPLIEFITFAIDWIGGKIQEGITAICSAFAGINEFLQGVFAKDWTEQFGAFGNVLNGFFANVENIWNAVKSIFSGIVGFIKSVFAGDWGAAWDSVVGIFKGVWDLLVSIVKAPINGIIGLINGLIQGVVNGINLVIKMLNSISFDVPEWVPGVGGETFGLSLATLQAPQIPYLAQGAVLPANRPFLAVVGDQRHGTNVEAPLETIQEAVAVVIDDYVSAMMAGFEALLAEQRATRQAVESIHIGDDALYKAVQRRSRVMAIARGGL